MSCPACDHPERGYTHVCEGSGTFLAAEAHDGGQVDPPAVLHRFDVDLRFVVHAVDEQTARTIMTGFVGMLLDEDAVAETVFTLTAREPVAA